MRTIERTSRFKRDYKRETKGPYRTTLEKDFLGVLKRLVNDQPLERKYQEHALAVDGSTTATVTSDPT